MDLEPAPVVVAVDHSNGNNNTNAQTLDLYRLLHVMETDPKGPPGTSANDIRMRADLLREKASQLASKDDTEFLHRINAACKVANAIAASLSETIPMELDSVQKIFYAKTGTTMEIKESDLTLSVPSSGHTTMPKSLPTKAPPSTPTAANQTALQKKVATPHLSVEDLQKEQRAQVEQAVAAMAQQMKDQTSTIHSRLQQQNQTLLSDMEDTAAHNMEQVTQVARDTEQHVKAGWTRSVATWTLFLTVVMAFLASLVIIGTIPKRPQACLFFCKNQQNFCRVLANGKQECLDAKTTTKVLQNKEGEKGGIHSDKQDMAGETKLDERMTEETSVDELPAATANMLLEEEEELDEEERAYIDAAYASATGDFKTLRHLMKDHPQILDKQDRNGWTLLMEAAHNGKKETLRVLLWLEADMSLESKHGQTALSLARGNGENHPCVLMLEEYFKQQSEKSHIEARHDCEVSMDGECIHTTKASTTITREAEETYQVPQGDTLRQEALREYEDMQQAHQNQEEQEATATTEKAVPSTLSHHDIDPDAMPTGARVVGLDFTAWDFRYAAQRSDMDQLESFMAQDVPISWLNEGDVNGWTALHLAVRAGNIEVVELLLRYGADASLMTNGGDTPLSLSVVDDVTELLVAHLQ